MSSLFIREVTIRLSVLWVMILEWKKLKKSKMFHVVAHMKETINQDLFH